MHGPCHEWMYLYESERLMAEKLSDLLVQVQPYISSELYKQRCKELVTFYNDYKKTVKEPGY